MTQGDFVATVKDEKIPDIVKSGNNDGEHMKQFTLTQGDFLKAFFKEEQPRIKKCSTAHDGDHSDKESVTIINSGSIKEKITFEKGDLWQSDDPKYHGATFTLGCIAVKKIEYFAEVSTFVGEA